MPHTREKTGPGQICASEFYKQIFLPQPGGLRVGGDREVGNRKPDMSPRGSGRTHFVL